MLLASVVMVVPHVRLKHGRSPLETAPRHHFASCNRHKKRVYNPMGWFGTDVDDARLERIEFYATRNNALLHALTRKVDTIMADLSKLTTDVDALTAAVAAAVTDLTGLSADIAALKAAAPADIQPAVDALAAKVEKATSDLTTATTANPA
jgi:hypothetical protein